MGSSWYSRKASGGAQRGETENRGEKRGEPKSSVWEGDDGLTESDVGENEMEELILICEDSSKGYLLQFIGFMNGSFAANVLKFKQVHRIYVCLPSTGR